MLVGDIDDEQLELEHVTVARDKYGICLSTA